MAPDTQGEVKPEVGKRSEGGDKSGKKKGRFCGHQNEYATPRFKGETKGVYGHIYNVEQNNQTDLCTETTKKLTSYAGRTYRRVVDIKHPASCTTFNEMSICPLIINFRSADK